MCVCQQRAVDTLQLLSVERVCWQGIVHIVCPPMCRCYLSSQQLLDTLNGGLVALVVACFVVSC
jgi:hypothetical protein